VRLLLLIVALATAASTPVAYLAAPRWDVVVVVDDSGSPIQGMTVRRVYENYPTEAQDHEEDRITDRQGQASFPPRSANASIARRFLFTIRAAQTGVHASFGRHAYVFAFGRGREESATSGQFEADWTGSPPNMSSRIIATAIHEMPRKK
jgi:hypothetical protein